MQRIDNNSTIDLGGGDQGFSEGDPGQGQPATTVDAVWLNNVQEEICTVIESKSIALNGNDTTQLLQAITQIVSDTATNSGIQTGDYFHTLRLTPKVGYIFMQGQTLGNTGSGADLEGDDYENLYTFYWTNVADVHAPVSGGRGATAAADWSAGKTLQIIDESGLHLIGVGSGSALGEVVGSNEVIIAQANLPNVGLAFSGTTGNAGAKSFPLALAEAGSLESIFRAGTTTGSTNTANNHSHSFSGTTDPMGSGTPMNIQPKALVGHYMQKL